MYYDHRSLVQTTPPTAEPVSLTDAQAYCRVDTDADDALIQSLISAARAYVEQFTNRQLMPATFTAAWDRFPMLPNSQFSPGNPNAVAPTVGNLWPLDPTLWSLILPKPPCIAINSISYYDTTNTLQVMPADGYVADTDSQPARIQPASGGYWPQTFLRSGAVQVQFTAGYTNGVPPDILLAMKLLVTNWFDNRDAVSIQFKPTMMPLAVESLLWTHRMILL